MIAAQSQSAKLGLWLFFAADSMFFLGLIGAYMVLRSGQADLFSAGVATLSKPTMMLSAILLLAGSAATQVRNIRLSLTLLFLAAAGFLIVTFSALDHPALPINSFQACYFTLTIVHALHVGAAMIAILLLLTGKLTSAKAIAFSGELLDNDVAATPASPFLHGMPRGDGDTCDRPFTSARNIGIYWHFLVLLWILLFPILFLTGT